MATGMAAQESDKEEQRQGLWRVEELHFNPLASGSGSAPGLREESAWKNPILPRWSPLKGPALDDDDGEGGNQLARKRAYEGGGGGGGGARRRKATIKHEEEFKFAPTRKRRSNPTSTTASDAMGSADDRDEDDSGLELCLGLSLGRGSATATSTSTSPSAAPSRGKSQPHRRRRPKEIPTGNRHHSGGGKVKEEEENFNFSRSSPSKDREGPAAEGSASRPATAPVPAPTLWKEFLGSSRGNLKEEEQEEVVEEAGYAEEKKGVPLMLNLVENRVVSRQGVDERRRQHHQDATNRRKNLNFSSIYPTAPGGSGVGQMELLVPQQEEGTRRKKGVLKKFTSSLYSNDEFSSIYPTAPGGSGVGQMELSLPQQEEGTRRKKGVLKKFTSSLYSNDEWSAESIASRAQKFWQLQAAVHSANNAAPATTLSGATGDKKKASTIIEDERGEERGRGKLPKNTVKKSSSDGPAAASHFSLVQTINAGPVGNSTQLFRGVEGHHHQQQQQQHSVDNDSSGPVRRRSLSSTAGGNVEGAVRSLEVMTYTETSSAAMERQQHQQQQLRHVEYSLEQQKKYTRQEARKKRKALLEEQKLQKKAHLNSKKDECSEYRTGGDGGGGIQSGKLHRQFSSSQAAATFGSAAVRPAGIISSPSVMGSAKSSITAPHSQVFSSREIVAAIRPPQPLPPLIEGSSPPPGGHHEVEKFLPSAFHPTGSNAAAAALWKHGRGRGRSGGWEPSPSQQFQASSSSTASPSVIASGSASASLLQLQKPRNAAAAGTVAGNGSHLTLGKGDGKREAAVVTMAAPLFSVKEYPYLNWGAIGKDHFGRVQSTGDIDALQRLSHFKHEIQGHDDRGGDNDFKGFFQSRGPSASPVVASAGAVAHQSPLQHTSSAAAVETSEEHSGKLQHGGEKVLTAITPGVSSGGSRTASPSTTPLVIPSPSRPLPTKSSLGRERFQLQGGSPLSTAQAHAHASGQSTSSPSLQLRTNSMLPFAPLQTLGADSFRKGSAKSSNSAFASLVASRIEASSGALTCTHSSDLEGGDGSGASGESQSSGRSSTRSAHEEMSLNGPTNEKHTSPGPMASEIIIPTSSEEEEFQFRKPHDSNTSEVGTTQMVSTVEGLMIHTAGQSAAPVSNTSLKRGIAADQIFGGSGSLPDLPWVTCTGTGSNGKSICGVVYNFTKGAAVRIVCACHGRHMSASEFVQHAHSVWGSQQVPQSLRRASLGTS